ncbi:ABC transporter ATP-binding protein [Microbulbifer spongiae]|uniref:ABC transporter ATP-binding protein n=1 Tax=Microbulbifer spongiae TaxID=2944933 RepID=A0ABY9E676_9GAMM|nr:ABC transporter ATP-binding protein [Microbulbifer sp. MI-G]WKD48177.1 ABC transporter ATP-binding protein [Microbulbifer sp. MI-G]
MIAVRDLTYRYPRSTENAVRGISFKIAQGEIVGLLGPSGAGKSTTQNILTGLLRGYGGQVKVMNRELTDWGKEYYEHVGVSFEFPNHYLKLTARENLEHFRSFYTGQTYDSTEVLGWVGLAEVMNQKVSAFSKGMKVRLNIARSIIHAPKILFLDEPTSGLDPTNARKIQNLVLELRSRGATVFITTHDMHLADVICDRVAFITQGTLRLIDAPLVLKQCFGRREITVGYINDSSETVQKRFGLDGIGNNAAFIELLRSAQRIETVHSQETTLHNVFIEVTGEALSP